VLASLIATQLSRRVGSGTLLVAVTFVEAAAWAVFGVGSNAWVGGAMLALVGGGSTVFNVVGVSLRQAIVPDRLIGRVVSTQRMVGFGAVPVGALLGGVVGRTLGVRAPFLLGAAILTASGLLALPVVNNRAIQAARIAAEAAAQTSDA